MTSRAKEREDSHYIQIPQKGRLSEFRGSMEYCRYRQVTAKEQKTGSEGTQPVR